MEYDIAGIQNSRITKWLKKLRAGIRNDWNTEMVITELLECKTAGYKSAGYKAAGKRNGRNTKKGGLEGGH